jgi:hypothetical protein
MPGGFTTTMCSMLLASPNPDPETNVGADLTEGLNQSNSVAPIAAQASQDRGELFIEVQYAPLYPRFVASDVDARHT